MSSEKKISDLDTVPSLDNTALFEIEQGGVSFKVTRSEIISAAGIQTINADTTSAQLLTGQTNKILIADDLAGNHTFTIGTDIVTLNDTQTLTGKTITAVANTLVIASTDLSDSASLARNTNNLSFFAATTSLQLLGVMSDETGTGLLMFNDTPTIITPTIASFANAVHSHLNVAGGGTITKAAISDFTHQVTHQSGGGDALTGLLDATARTSVSKNSAADVGARRTLNFIEGSNITLTIVDDVGGEEIDITIAASAGGPEFADDVFRITGSADATKKLAFEVDGITTTTTRTITMLNEDLTIVGLTNTQTLTGKTLNLTSNTLVGTKAQFNTALSDGTFAFTSDNLSVFAATTSLQLLGVISDETGSGLLVFNDTPTILTPTIASFVNATHDHEAAAGGGQLDSTLALSDTSNIAYLNTANVYTAGARQDFLGLLAGTAGLNVGGIAGNPTTQVNGDIWYNSSTNTMFGRINGVDVDLGQSGAEVFTWTDNHDANTFALLDARFADDVDATKIIDLNLVGMTTGIIGTLDFNFTTAKTITFPDATTTMVGTGIADQLTNTELTSGVFAKITGVGVQTQALDMNTQILQFVDANQTIQNNAGNLFYDVATGQVHLWRINNVTEMQLSATALAMQGNAVLQVGFLTSFATDPSTVGVIRLGNTELVAWRNFGNTADITLGVSASDELELNGAPLVLEDNGLKLENPAGTFNYTIQSAAISDNRILNLPLITATDTLAVLGLAQILTNKTLGAGTVFSVIPTINDGITFTFNPNATVAGLNIGAQAGDPSTLVNGDSWYNSTTNKFRARENAVSVDMIGAGGASLWTALADYEASVAEGTTTLSFTAVDFDDDSKLVLVIDIGTTLTLNLLMQVNSVTASGYFTDGSRISAGSQTIIDVNASSSWQIGTSTMLDGTQSACIFVEVGLTKAGNTRAKIVTHGYGGDKFESVGGESDAAIASISQLVVFTSTSTWKIGTRMTVYKVARAQ